MAWAQLMGECGPVWPWCVLLCVALAASPSSRPLTLEQRLLLIAWPASCAWQLRERRGKGENSATPFSSKLLQLLAAVGMTSFISRIIVTGSGAFAAALPCASLLSLAHMTFPLELPLGEFVPWWSLLVLGLILVIGPEDMRAAAGLRVGRINGGPLMWSAICMVISTLALVGWSKIWVRGDHGPIQDALAPMMSPASVLPLAIVNALREPCKIKLGSALSLIRIKDVEFGISGYSPPLRPSSQ